MIHQRKPNEWSCAITALAMALRHPVEKIVEEAGHDGSEIVFPHLKEPMKRRGFHSQELVRIAWNRGFAMTPLELFPRIQSNDGKHVVKVWSQSDGRHWNRFGRIISETYGILEGSNRKCLHAVYNDYGTLYDPDPGFPPYQFSELECTERSFYPNRLWVFTQYD